MAKYNIIDASGKNQEIDVNVEDYKAAGEAGLSLSQYLQQHYPYDTQHGTTMEQCMASANLFLRADEETGLVPPTMKSVLEGGMKLDLNGITRNDGNSNNTVTGRMLFPEVIMQIIQNELTENQDDFINGYNGMIATNAFVNSPKVDQPVIDVKAPENSASQPIAQLAEPAVMVSITVSETSRRVPTKSIGLTISDEALSSTTLDLVGLAMTSQARGERIRTIEEQLNGMLNGNTDFGEDPLGSVTAQSFDGTISAASELTQKAWVKYLRAKYRKMTVTDIICDIDTALAIENRTGKPVITGDDPNSPRIDALFNLQNLGITAPRILLVESPVAGANTIVGLDRRYAIRRVVNVAASYDAIESYVMRRATSFRVDYGEMSHKLFTDAWHKMTLTL